MLERIVRKNLEEELGITLTLTQQNNQDTSEAPSPPSILKDISRFPRLTQWTIKRKDWLDQRLEIEMRADEPTWLNYKPFEVEVLNNLTTKVLEDTFSEVFKNCTKNELNSATTNCKSEGAPQLNGVSKISKYKELQMDSVHAQKPDTSSETIS